MPSEFSSKQLENFRKASASLKLFSRAEVNDDRNRSLVEKLYVDPLPNEHVFKTLLSENSTIIIGRKGTGKSTIFQRVQHEVRKNKTSVISAYMDIRNVFEESQIDPVTASKIDQFDTALSQEQIQKFLLYKKFFRKLITDIRDELKSQVEQSFLTRLRDRLMGTSSEVFAGLDRIIENLDTPDYENIDGFISKERKDNFGEKSKIKQGINGEINVSPVHPTLKIGVNVENEQTNEQGEEDVYTQLLMRVIGVNQVISELQHILSALEIRTLFIFLDDFSELPYELMKILVDTLISPLSRWSEFIKFKIAAYPGRVYLGTLDTTKIEEINLDIYGLYGSAGVTKMEEKAIDFVRRVVEKRLTHFCKVDPSVYFNTQSSRIWRTMFYASIANPRILEHMMLYTYESNLIYSNKIGTQAIQAASQRYYEEKVLSFFSTGRFRVAFEERSSIYSLRELLDSIVTKARNIRQEGSRDKKSSKQLPYASHFYVSHEYDDLLQSLELSFFVTKYFEQSDRAGVRVSVYALNYGLCAKYQIGFGRPTETREHRLYFVNREFDFNSVARSYMVSNQEIKCDSCDKEFDLSMLPAIRTFMMRCPSCNVGRCRVVNLSKKYGDLLDEVGPELLLPNAELGILQTLNGEGRSMVAAEIAGELDYSGQLVGRRARHLFERSLVTRKYNGRVYKYDITKGAKEAYFSNGKVEEDDENRNLS